MSDAARGGGLSKYGTIFFIICFLLAGYALYVIFRPFIAILIWACVLSVVFFPLYRKILRAARGRETLASFITCLLILLLIVLPVTSLGALITKQSISLYHSIQSNLSVPGGDASERLAQLQNHPWVRRVLDQAGQWLGAGSIDLGDYVRQLLGSVSRWVISQGPSFLAGVGGMLFSFLMMFITMFFLFRDGPRILEFVRSSNPLPAAYQSEIGKKFQDVSYATFFGSILTAMVQGLAGGLLFWALGLPSPLFWGAVVAFVSLVPIVGAFLVWVPMGSYLFLIGQSTRGIILLAIGGIVVSSIDNVLKPMIIRERTKMHPLLVFFSVLGGMQAFGLLGILLGPLIIAVFLSFLNFYRLEFAGNIKPATPE